MLEESAPPPVAPPPVAPPPRPTTKPGTATEGEDTGARDRGDKRAASAEEEGGEADERSLDSVAESFAGSRDRGAPLPLDRSGSARQADDPGGYQRSAPPAEKWRSWQRHRITAEEIVEGIAGFNDLPVGDILRLNVMVGPERIEGTLRFTPRQSSLTEVRILSLSTGPGAKLTYVASLEVLSPEDSPPGVRWLD